MLFFYEEWTLFVGFCSTDYLKSIIVLYNQNTHMGPYHGGKLLKIFLRVVFYPKKRNEQLILNVSFFFHKSFWSSRSRMFYKSGVLKYFPNCTRKQICRSFYYNKEAGLRLQKRDFGTGVFQQILQNFSGSLFSRILPATACNLNMYTLMETLKRRIG